MLMKLEFYPQTFEKHSNIYFNENPSSGITVAPRGQTDGQIDTAKLKLPFCSFAKGPKTNNFMPCEEMFVGCSNNPPEHINTLRDRMWKILMYTFWYTKKLLAFNFGVSMGGTCG
jgi:hypothetical protein